MSQRQLLENGINLLHKLQGPAKILYAPGTLAMPVRIEQVIDPTGGAPASGWSTLGLTGGGINVTKTTNMQVYEDVDQILGPYDQSVTSRAYRISTQLKEILDSTQLALAAETGASTQVSTTGATQVMTLLDSGSNRPTERRVAVVFPKSTEGKVYAFVFRRVQSAGGDQVFRFDKSDPVSPALDLLAFPEIATSIPSEDAFGRIFNVL